MPCQQRIVDAKASFVSKVSEGISKLMDCGYSRERATNVLMRELNRGESHPRPTDEEIFEAMKRYHLGIEEATKAIVISRAMRRAMSASESPAHAIELLASKISLANLLYDSADESSPDNELSIRPELRVEPVVAVDRSRKTIRNSKTRPLSKSTNGRSRTITNSTKSASRKRTIEEIAAPQEKTPTKRDRSDSVSEEVNKKIAKQSSEDATSAESSSTSLLRAPAVRGKRVLGRVDDAEGQSNCHKRIRGNEGC